MPPITEPRTRGRGRPRNPHADERVRGAALEEYADRGWAGFTMDGVARRAGVGKSTLYLRWADKLALLQDAVDSRAEMVWAVDTGTLRGDLEALAARLLSHYQTPSGWVSLRLAVDAVVTDSPWRDHDRTTSAIDSASTRSMLERAVERGELDPAVDHLEAVHCLGGAVTMHAVTMRGDATLSDDEVARRSAGIVDLLLRGAAAS